MYKLESIIRNIDEFSLSIKDCEFDKGRIYAVTGPNGSGKTSLLDLLAFISRPTFGTVTFNGQAVDYSDTSRLADIRRQVGCLLQNPYLFNMNVFNNIGYSLKIRHIDAKTASTKIHDIMEMMNLSQLAKRNAHSLSRGESQRVALARAIVTDAPVYLLDEPSANVDKTNITVIEEAITRLKHENGATVIFSTHSARQAERIADEIIELDEGRITRPAKHASP